MSMIKPYSSFPDTLIADFPALKLYWHMDDVVSGANKWIDRVSGVTINKENSGTFLKDANGLYVTDTNDLTLTGTLPNPGSYTVIGMIGQGQTGTVSTGLTAILGGGVGSGADGFVINTSVAIHAGSSINSAASLTGTQTVTGARVCFLNYYDMVDTTSPVIWRAKAVRGDNVIAYGAGTTTSTNQIVIDTLGPFVACAPLTVSDNGARIAAIFMLDFATSIATTGAIASNNDLQVMASQMVHNDLGELFAGWRNKT